MGVIASLLLFMKGHWRSITPACTDLHQGKARAQAGLITGFCRQVLSDVLAIPLEAEAVDDYTSVDNPADAVGNVEKRGSRCAVWHGRMALQSREQTMKRAILAITGIAALSLAGTAHAADESDAPPPSPPPHFRPWQQVWQCNDVRVTITGRDPFSVEYDIGGMIWGGSRFTVVKGDLFFNGRPCLPLQPVGY